MTYSKRAWKHFNPTDGELKDIQIKKKTLQHLSSGHIHTARPLILTSLHLSSLWPPPTIGQGVKGGTFFPFFNFLHLHRRAAEQLLATGALLRRHTAERNFRRLWLLTNLLLLGRKTWLPVNTHILSNSFLSLYEGERGHQT